MINNNVIPNVGKDLLTVHLKKILRLSLRMTMAFFLFVFSFAIPAHADLGMTTNPQTIYISTRLPADISAPLSIKNTTSQEEQISYIVKPFSVDNDGKVKYQPFVKEDSKNIKDHIKLFDGDQEIKDSFALSPNERKKLDLRIQLTQQQSLSDYYFSILFITNNTSDIASNASFQQIGTAINVILSIGDKDTKGSLEDFSAPLINDEGPISFNISVKNAGSHVFTSKGYILITNMFGQTIGKIDLPNDFVLAKATRTIPEAWKDKIKFGLYTADLYLTYFPNTQVNHSTIHFFAFPLQTGKLILLLIVLALFISYRVSRYRK